MTTAHWQPTAPLAMLQKRAAALAKVRHYFAEQKVLEVDVPALSSATVPDCYIDSLQTKIDIPGTGNNQPYFLHTSPEYAMKRLLCAGSGDIYFLGKVYRQGDYSPRHQPEFTLVEWYRLGYSLREMMQETSQVIQLLLGSMPTEYLTYQAAFQRYVGIENIHQACAQQCKAALMAQGVADIVGVAENDKNLWEQLLLTEVIEAQLGQQQITVLYDYPTKDSALAKVSTNNADVAERFEVFVNGMELANGYFELQDGEQYEQRFQASLAQRQQQGKLAVPIDQNLIGALNDKQQGGLPLCSGVALGFDRLLALVEQQNNIEKVMPFSITNS